MLPLPIPPIHAALFPNGKIVFWAYDEDSSTNTNKLTRTFLWNPVLNDTPVEVDQPNSKLFCSGHSLLPDGRLLTIGGILRPTPLGQPQLGVKDTSIFNSSTSTWSKAADMKMARYYPSSVPLANGDVLAVAGTNDTNGANIDTSEVWQTTSSLPETDPGRYRLLSTAKFSQGWYPMAFQAPNGKVFNLGPQPTMGYLDTTGSGTWTSLGNRTDPANSIGNGKRTYGTAAMYEPGKIVLIGGVDPPTNTAVTVNINGSSPVVTQVGSMSAARRQHNARPPVPRQRPCWQAPVCRMTATPALLRGAALWRSSSVSWAQWAGWTASAVTGCGARCATPMNQSRYRGSDSIRVAIWPG